MGKATSAKPSKSAKRRDGVRRNLPRPSMDYLAVLRRPEIIRASVIFVALAVLATAVIDWTRGQLLILEGQIMTETRLARTEYRDDERTNAAIHAARQRAPRIFRPNTAYLEQLRTELTGLPRAVTDKTRPDQITEELRNEYLTAEVLVALQDQAIAGEPTAEWHQRVQRLIDREVIHNPLLNSDDFQIFTVTHSPRLQTPEGRRQQLNPRYGIELRDGEINEQLFDIVRDAEFPRIMVPYIAAWLAKEPTITLDAELTSREEDAAEGTVDVNMVEEGTILYARGDRLEAAHRTEVERESATYAGQMTTAERWLPRLGIFGLCLAMAIALQVFVTHHYRRLARNVVRVVTLCTLMATMLVVAAGVTKHAPMVLYFSSIGTTLVVALVVLLVYDQRLAIVVGAVQTVLVSLAMQQSVGWIILVLLGCATMIAQLPEVRHRNSLIRAASGTALVLGLGALVLGPLEIPLVDGAWRQISVNAGWAGAASFSVGFLVLGMLPSIERLFGVTTGMTLAELRDPKQPLLRQLQQRAPGTYNHSLQVANLCEAAAEAIGANGLLIYVGALYHDIGKVNKPEYFVENQARGDNKHEKLSPAMSLLVIIGHVKDGIELAREYGLPRPLIHFIESHHGTTLVEYFYHAAREKAESDEKLSVDEVVFRYPGPKPLTREAAILMLADAVESATRTMAEPNPARLESLVRTISRKRMTDGQFDQCPLTFRELGLIEEAVINRLCAIHHGRISYPSQRTVEADDVAARVRA